MAWLRPVAIRTVTSGKHSSSTGSCYRNDAQACMERAEVECSVELRYMQGLAGWLFQFFFFKQNLIRPRFLSVNRPDFARTYWPMRFHRMEFPRKMSRTTVSTRLVDGVRAEASAAAGKSSPRLRHKFRRTTESGSSHMRRKMLIENTTLLRSSGLNLM